SRRARIRRRPSPEKDRDAAVRILKSRWHEHADRSLERGAHLGMRDDLPEVRRSDLLLALRNKHEVDWNLLPSSADRVERRQECCLGPFLIHRAAPDEDLAESGPVHESGGE